MLREIRVENLGIIAEATMTLGPGMTAVTGETGAGKTLVVEALKLLAGSRADSSLVRDGSDEGRAEGRFELTPEHLEMLSAVEAVDGAEELVLTRAVPSEGRSRAYVNGRLVPVGVLAEIGDVLIELHAQHGHQTLLRRTAQRSAVDAWAGTDVESAASAYGSARRRLEEIEASLGALGGDDRERVRQIDLLRFQMEEIDAAGIEDPTEDERLAARAALLADADAHREAAEAALVHLDEAAQDRLGEVVDSLGSRGPLEDLAGRAAVLQEELSDLARDLRSRRDEIDDDPAQLAALQERRAVLTQLRRKYGEDLHAVLAFRAETRRRLAELEDAEQRAVELEAERTDVRAAVQEAGAALSAARREAARPLADALTEAVQELAMPGAQLTVEVRSEALAADDGVPPPAGVDEVEFLLAANPGESAQPLRRVASGGELARTMLAARVVLSGGPPTMVFDEVDAGIGGEAGVAVGRKLAQIADAHQVFCVTHLAQVAAFADHHLVVRKQDRRGRTVAEVELVEGSERVVELSRMLAGHGTARAREHAEELLGAARERSR